MKFLVFVLLSTSIAIFAQSDRCPPGHLYTGSSCQYWEQRMGPGSCEGQNKTLDSVCLHIFMKIHEDIEQTVYPFACQPEEHSDEDCCKEVTGIEDEELEQRSCQNCGFRIDYMDTSFIRSKDLCVKTTPKTEKTTCAVTPTVPTTMSASKSKLKNDEAMKCLLEVMSYYAAELEFEQSKFDVLSSILQEIIMKGSEN